MQVWNVLHAARWNIRRKNSPSAHHRTTLSGYVLATKAYIDNRKTLVKQQYLLHMSSQYGEVNVGLLTDDIGWWVWGTSANFNVFCVLASSPHRRCSTEVNQTLHDVWPPPGLVHYIYNFGGSCPLTEFCQVQNSLCVQVLRSPILAALLHGTWAESVSQTLRHGIFTRQGGHPVRHWAVELSSWVQFCSVTSMWTSVNVLRRATARNTIQHHQILELLSKIFTV